MKPVPYKEVIEKMAFESNMEEDLLLDLTNFYWKKLAVAMSEFKSSHIRIEGFGSFRIIKKKAENYLHLLKSKNAKHYRFGILSEKSNVRIEKKIKDLLNLFLYIHEEDLRKQQIYARRYGSYTPSKKTNRLAESRKKLDQFKQQVLFNSPTKLGFISKEARETFKQKGWRKP